MNLPQLRTPLACLFVLLATLLTSSPLFAQDGDNDGGNGDPDPCLCANESRQMSTADSLVYVVVERRVSIVVADLYPTFHHAKPGRCSNGTCQDPKACDTSFDLTLTIHDDAALRRQTNSNVLRFDGRIVSVQAPHTKEVRQKTACSVTQLVVDYPVKTFADDSFLQYQYEFNCRPCTAAGASSGD